MRIAYVSFEYAGAAGGGGIGTYVRNAARMMAGRGHDIEVFTGPWHSPPEAPLANVKVHVVPAERQEFRQRVVEAFRARHDRSPFDLVEGPEFGSEAAAVFEQVPSVARVVRLHGPSFTIAQSNAAYVGRRARLRYALGSLRRGRLPRDPWRYDLRSDPEMLGASIADELVANSRATAERVQSAWSIPREKLSVVPLPISRMDALLAVDARSLTRTVLFTGRLEVRKGVLDLADAIPNVLAACPDVRFRFIGRVLPHPADHVPLDVHMRKRLGRSAAAVEILGSRPYEDVVQAYGECDLCVFPSEWEASGYVCLEAMLAGRGVIGSSAGGMSEIIEHGRTGLLVPPRDPRAIADAILSMLGNPSGRISMGEAARQSVLTTFAPDAIAPLQEAAYVRAAERAAARIA